MKRIVGAYNITDADIVSVSPAVPVPGLAADVQGLLVITPVAIRRQSQSMGYDNAEHESHPGLLCRDESSSDYPSVRFVVGFDPVHGAYVVRVGPTKLAEWLKRVGG